ncbi:MAG: hypothetical protein E7395_00940 [Ruminococcaceae bacterium]|nr:hypothetical protein [Oscillospiraceae bacterium]
MEKTLIQKKKLSFVQILWLTAGFALLVGAILAGVTPNERIISVSRTLGFLMFYAGLINIIVYLSDKNPLRGAHWIIADGLTTALLSLFLVFNNVVDHSLIPFFFGVWELFSGVLKVIESIELRDYHIKGWRWFVVIGNIELFSGISAMIEPVDNLIGIHSVIAAVLLIQALGFVFKIGAYRHLVKTTVD